MRVCFRWGILLNVRKTGSIAKHMFMAVAGERKEMIHRNFVNYTLLFFLSTVALTGSLPVDVFMKSEPAICFFEKNPMASLLKLRRM